MNILIQPEYRGRESLTLINYTTSNNLNFKVSKDYIDGYLPVGSVEWVEGILLNVFGISIIPDYYPDFLNEFLYRNVWYSDKNPKSECFVKPADRYKRFNGQIFNESLEGPFWCSDIIEFVNEYRFYIANSEILCGWWYSGDESKIDYCPTLDFKFPDLFCGAVDFGETVDGKLALIESHHPYAIGWYGDDHHNYYKFLVDGWNSLIGSSKFY